MNETPAPQYQPPQFTQTPPQSVRVAASFVKPYVMYVIFGLTVCAYLLQLTGKYLLPLVSSSLTSALVNSYGTSDFALVIGAKINTLIRLGQIWRLVTPVFLHGSLLHIGFNMYALFVYGRSLESRYGHGRFFLLYFLSAYAGNVLSFLLTPNVSVGASTAIFGLIGAEAVFHIQNRKLLGKQSSQALWNLFYFAAINLFIGFTTTGVDNWGHIGGLLGGLLFAWFGGPRWKLEGLYPALQLVDEREGRGWLQGTLIVLLCFLPLTALGWFWIAQ